MILLKNPSGQKLTVKNTTKMWRALNKKSRIGRSRAKFVFGIFTQNLLPHKLWEMALG